MTVLNFIPFSRIPRLNSSKNIKCFFRNLKRFQSIALGFCRISRKIIIETSLKHLMFVRKCQAILKQVWSCSGQIPRAWAYSHLESRGRFSEYCTPERPNSLKFKLRSFYVGLTVFHKNLKTTALSTLVQKPKFLNSYQIFFKEFDDNFLKTFTGWAANKVSRHDV